MDLALGAWRAALITFRNWLGAKRSASSSGTTRRLARPQQSPYNRGRGTSPLAGCHVSVIWDLLREASAPNGHGQAEPVEMERRQSPRSSVYVPVFVYGYASEDEPFHQESNTLQVNANGGLLRLDTNVQRGQKLLVMNRVTKEEQECYVVSLAKRPKHADLRVGIAFAKAAPGFWDSRK